MQEVSGQARTHDLWVCIHCTRCRLRYYRLAKTAYAILGSQLFACVTFHSSLHQLGPQVQARMNSHRLQCIRNGIIKKKVTIDLHQLKATFQKIIFHLKKKVNHRRPLFPDRPPYCFFSGIRIFFF